MTTRAYRVAYGEAWEQRLPSGADLAVEMSRLTQAVDSALADKYPPASPFPDTTEGTVTLRRSIPATNLAAGIREFQVMVALQVQQHTPAPDGGGSRLVVIPRVAVEVTRRKDALNWLEQDSEADLDALTREILTLLTHQLQQAGAK